MKTTISGPSPRLKVLPGEVQMAIQSFWDDKLKDPRAMVPAAKLKELTLTDTEIRKGKEQFGKSAGGYLRWSIRKNTRDSDVARRMADKKEVLTVGFGQGHDHRGVVAGTVKLGLRTRCVDVSSIAEHWARTSLENQFNAMQHTSQTLELRPQVIWSEIQSLLADPSLFDLDMSRVEICYLCRLLNCLPTSSAKIVLQELGRTMFSLISNNRMRNSIIIINALSDDNSLCTCCSATSVVRSMRMILANIGYGARCAVTPRWIRHFDYFGKKVTAMTIMVKS